MGWNGAIPQIDDAMRKPKPVKIKGRRGYGFYVTSFSNPAYPTFFCGRSL